MKKRFLAGAAAAVVAAASLSGCGENKKEEDATKISWYLSGVKQDSTYDDVFNKVNEIMEERYGLKLNIVMTDGTNYSQKLQMMNAAQESYDLAFTSNWANDYYTNVINGSLLDLTERLPKEAPKLYESLSNVEKESAAIDGRIYAVPNWQVQARAMGFMIPTEKLDMAGCKIDDINSFEDLEKYFAAVTEIEPETNKGGGEWESAMINYGLLAVTRVGFPGCIYYKKEGKPQIINQYDSPEFLEYAKLMKSWVEKGYLPKVHNEKDDSTKDHIVNPGAWSNWKPGVGLDITRRAGYEILAKQISPAVLSTEAIIATMTGVGANSKNPEAALKVLEIMYTDKELYNMLSWGIEGVNYDKISDNMISIKEGSTYTMSNWMLGSVANSFVTEGNPENIWDITKEFNDSAVVSPLLGFTLDTSEISSELGNCENVVKEYLDTIQYGTGTQAPEEIIAQLNAELKVAGVDKVLTVIQKQIDEWWAENK